MSIKKQAMGTTPDGADVSLYTLTNSRGTKISVMTLGATLTAVETADREGKCENITLGMKTLDDYVAGHPCFGSVPGRFANRIAKGRFTLDGREYVLAVNNGPNHLHGGRVGFDKKIWQAEASEGCSSAGVGFASVKLTYTSPDGEEGYPGTLTATVTYALSDDDRLTMAYTAVTDKPTHVNLTNHAYWNLAGQAAGYVLDQELTINADNYLPVDAGLIPLGMSHPVKGTEMDFTRPQKIGARIAATGGGYDHCYVLNKTPAARAGDAIGDEADARLTLAARAYDPRSGRTMEVFTTQPGVQLYTANGLDGGPRSGGFPKHAGFCLETQHYPDSPNRPEFPTTVLRPGETYREITIHKFGVMI